MSRRHLRGAIGGRGQAPQCSPRNCPQLIPILCCGGAGSRWCRRRIVCAMIASMRWPRSAKAPSIRQYSQPAREVIGRSTSSDLSDIHSKRVSRTMSIPCTYTLDQCLHSDGSLLANCRSQTVRECRLWSPIPARHHILPERCSCGNTHTAFCQPYASKRLAFHPEPHSRTLQHGTGD
jgi:hypothetical protein